ncbi:MAG: hypothetical protein NC395_05555 [Prevotella sp.]|nr:hypothetical protein [Prevotella sp.]
MAVTIIAAAVICADLFLTIWGAAAFMPPCRVGKWLPKDLREAMNKLPDKPKFSTIIGTVILIFGCLIYAGAIIFAAYDGIKNGFSFWNFFARFMIIMYCVKAFDIIVLDYFLITKTKFFQHFYPETEGNPGYNQFGFNKKQQITRIVLFPFLCLAAAGICMLF